MDFTIRYPFPARSHLSSELKGLVLFALLLLAAARRAVVSVGSLADLAGPVIVLLAT